MTLPTALAGEAPRPHVHRILDCLVRMLTPILVHTAEEAWAAMQTQNSKLKPVPSGAEGTQNFGSVHLALMPKVDDSIDWQSTEPRWQKLMALRDEVLQVLEGLRRDKKIASNQEARVTIYCNDQDAALLHEFGVKQFAALCIVSEVNPQKGHEQTIVAAEKSRHNKCQRCWNYWPSVGTDSEYPDLCERCVSVLRRA